MGNNIVAGATGSVVPEPSSAALLGLGLISMGAVGVRELRRRKREAAALRTCLLPYELQFPSNLPIRQFTTQEPDSTHDCACATHLGAMLHDTFVVSRCLDHQAALANIVRTGFFDVHMLAGIARHDRGGCVPMNRRCNDHNIDRVG